MATQKNNNDSFNQATPQKKEIGMKRDSNTPKTIDFKMKTNAASQSRRR